MIHSRRIRLAVAFGIIMTLHAATKASAQGPQVNVDESPGVPNSLKKLGPPLGASGSSGFDATSLAPIGGRTGAAGSRAPREAFDRTTRQSIDAISQIVKPAILLQAQVASYGELDLPDILDDEGPSNGLTLDTAIETLMRENLSLQALRFEIPMAHADILTASLRANPIFYADAQLVPYGRFSAGRPGGQTQYDVNVSYPLDITQKRVKRTEVAQNARKVTEFQLQDAVRIQIDNLYTAFVDVDAADETVRFSQAGLNGIEKLLAINEGLLTKGQVSLDVVEAIRSQRQQAKVQTREAAAAVVTTTQSLALLLNIPNDQVQGLRLRATLKDERPLPDTREALKQIGMRSRPDLAAYRLGVARADSEIRLAKANRVANPYLLVQPFTLQDNRPFGLKSPISYAVGLTTELPIFNRNQGNIARTSLNSSQTRIEFAQLERQVEHDIEFAIREFELSLDNAIQIDREVIPSARNVRDASRRRYQGGETNAIAFIEAQKSFNEVVKTYRDALVRHRRAMLDLNTAVGVRVLP